MDNFHQTSTPLDIHYCGHLNLGVFPLFIAIGQIFFNQTYYFAENQYLKIYVAHFPNLIELYITIMDIIDSKKESLTKLPFLSLNTWQVIKENDVYVCIIESPNSYKLKFTSNEFLEFLLKLKDIIFKPLCISTLYSSALQKIAANLSKNTMENLEKVDLFSFETIEFMINELFNGNVIVDQNYLIELTLRNQDLIKVFLEIEQMRRISVQKTFAKPIPPDNVHDDQVASPLQSKKVKYTQSELVCNESGSISYTSTK